MEQMEQMGLVKLVKLAKLLGKGKERQPELASFPIRKASAEFGLSSFPSYSTSFLNMSPSIPRQQGRTLVESPLSTPASPCFFVAPFQRSKSVKELIQQAEAAAAAAGGPFPGSSEGDRRASPFRPLPRPLSQLSQSHPRPTSLGSAAASGVSSPDIVRDKPLEPSPAFYNPVSVTSSDSLDSIDTDYSEFLSDIEEEYSTTYRTPQTCNSPSCSDRCTPEPYFLLSPINSERHAVNINDLPPVTVGPFELSEDQSGWYNRSYSPSSSRELFVAAPSNRYRALSPLVETSAEDSPGVRNSEAPPRSPLLSPARVVSPSPAPARVISSLPSPAPVSSPPVSPCLSLGEWARHASADELVPILSHQAGKSSKFELQDLVQGCLELTVLALEPGVPTSPITKVPISPGTWVWDASIYEFVPVSSGVGQSSRFVKSSSRSVHLATDSAADSRQMSPPRTPSPVREPTTSSLTEAFNQSAKTMPKNQLPPCCQQELLEEVKKLEDQLPGNLTYVIPPNAVTHGRKGAGSENVNPNARPINGHESATVVPNPPDAKKLTNGDVPAVLNSSGIPNLAAPNLPSLLDGAGGLDDLSVPSASPQPRMRSRIKKRSVMLIRRVRRVVFKTPVLSVVLGRQLAKPTANALAIVSRGGTVGADVFTAAPVPRASPSLLE